MFNYGNINDIKQKLKFKENQGLLWPLTKHISGYEYFWLSESVIKMTDRKYVGEYCEKVRKENWKWEHCGKQWINSYNESEIQRRWNRYLMEKRCTETMS